MTKRMKHVCIWVATLMLAASLTVLSAGAATEDSTEDSTSTEESEGTVFDECDALIAEILDELGTKKFLLAGGQSRLDKAQARLDELKNATDTDTDELETELTSMARELTRLLASIEDGSGIRPYYGRFKEYLGEVETAMTVVTVSNEMRRELADIRLALIAVEDDVTLVSHADASVKLKPLYDRLEALENRILDCANGRHEFENHKPQGNGTMLGYCKHGCGASETLEDPSYVPPTPKDPKEEIPLAVWIGVSAIVVCCAVLFVIHGGKKKSKTLKNKKK